MESVAQLRFSCLNEARMALYGQSNLNELPPVEKIIEEAKKIEEYITEGNF